MILALVIDRAIQARSGSESAFQDVTNPQARPIGGIPQCQQVRPL